MVTPRHLAFGSLAVGLAAVWLVMFLQGTGPVDRGVLSALYAGDHAMLVDSARLITLLGGGYWVTPLIALTALALALKKRPWPALVLFAGNSFGRLLVELQKYELGRVRPDLNPHLVSVSTLSFPSAHSANAVLTYVALALMLPKDSSSRTWWLAIAGAISIVIGFTRVLLGVHWPSDVIGGWSFGLLWVMGMVWVERRTPPRLATR